MEQGSGKPGLLDSRWEEDTQVAGTQTHSSLPVIALLLSTASLTQTHLNYEDSVSCPFLHVCYFLNQFAVVMAWYMILGHHLLPNALSVWSGCLFTEAKQCCNC